MRVFIDANIYLHFVRPSNENVKSLDELEALIKENKISLFFPLITKNEFLRNISFIALSHQGVIKKKAPSTPSLEESETIVAYKEYLEKLKNLSNLYLKSVKTLRKRIIGIYERSEHLDETEDLLKKAYFRKLKGNPPGKKDHIGDELAWEMLLHSTKEKDDELAIITQDRDWKEMMPDSKGQGINLILEEEWKTFSKNNISFFNTVGEFINKFTGKAKIAKKDLEREKKEPFYSGYPYFLNPQNTGTPSLISTPSLGTYATGPSGPSVMGGSPGFLPKSTQCVDCGKDRDNASFYCNECLVRRGLI